MRSRAEIWRQRLGIWVPAVVFFLANLGAFAVYQLGYAGRVETLEERLEAQEQTLKKVDDERKELETMLARVQTNERQVEQLYAQRLSTRSQRLTSVTSEVRGLARRAGLEPRAISYPEEAIEEYGLIKRSFNFTVEGTYSELRQFINLLEVSRSFVAIEEINLIGNTDEGPELQIDLSLATFFSREDPELSTPAPAAATPRGGAL